LYISGFDPKGPRFYHQLYAAEAAKRTAWHGGQIEVGEARRQGRSATVWSVTAQLEDGETKTEFEILRWDDIMRAQMRKGLFFSRMVDTYWLYATSGTLWKIFKLGYPPFITGIYPVVILMTFVLAGLIITGLFTWIGMAAFAAPAWIAALLVAPVGYSVYRFTRWFEKRVPYIWPVHVYNFAADRSRGRIGKIEERIDQFAERIRTCVRDSDDDEVLIVGHSNGASVAVSAIARALTADPGLASRGPAIALLTLGESIMLDSLLPQAGDLRNELVQVAGDNGLAWIDITAPRDGACFARTDPLSASGMSSAVYSDGPKPRLLSVSMTDLFSPETWSSTLKHRWLRIHFQYLMAYEKRTSYDYFAITAGPQTLQSRFAAFRSRQPFAKFQLTTVAKRKDNRS